MASKKKAKKSPVKKKPTKAEQNKVTLAEMLKQARGNREANKNIIKEMREDPDRVDAVKELLIADLLRVFAIPRRILGKSASRNRYRAHGNFSCSAAVYVFGAWPEFQREAGLADSLAIKAVERNISKTYRAQKVATYAEQYVKPYNTAFGKIDTKASSVLLQIGSDFHYPNIDPFTTRVWLDVAKKYKPHVRYNGDGPDFPKISKHRQIPGNFPLSLQQECDGWKNFMKETRKATGPKSDHKWVLGNHCMRLVYALAEAGPIYSMRDLRFNKVFDLDKLEIGLVARSTFLNPTEQMKKTDIAQNWETLFELFTIVHGFLHGKTSAKDHMARFMRFGTNGHLHDPCMVSGGSDATGVHQWWQTGCMGFPEALGKDYLPGPIQWHGWTPGFLMATIFPQAQDRFVSCEQVLCGDVATYRGQVWRITEDERQQRAAMLVV